jgi:hypothetical protein
MADETISMPGVAMPEPMPCRVKNAAIMSKNPLTPRKKYTLPTGVTTPPDLMFEAK